MQFVKLVGSQEEFDDAVGIFQSYGLDWDNGIDPSRSWKDIIGKSPEKQIGITMRRGKMYCDWRNTFSINLHVYEFINLETLKVRLAKLRKRGIDQADT